MKKIVEWTSGQFPKIRRHCIKACAVVLMGLYLTSCASRSGGKDFDLDEGMVGWITESMTDVMVHDITNPPLAARFYAYASIAGYEVISQQRDEYPSLRGVLNEYPDIPLPEGLDAQHTQLSAALAMIEVASTIQPSGPRLQDLKKALLDSCRSLGASDQTIHDSEAYAAHIKAHILDYAKADRYSAISNYPRYTPSEGAGYWYPTPPGYFAPVEPYFNTVRPFTLISADQFEPAPPVTYSEESDSEFFQLMRQVYEVELDEKTRHIAAFWDCNPFALEETGHLMVGLKQISPGGHWIGITDIACRKANVGFEKALEITTAVAVGLMDGFMSCWDEKYRSNRIRPETAIRRLLDSSYSPLLQTPPFPEYLSGHSTISTTSAEILTHYFGDGFGFTDTVEEKYHLGTRDFVSFNQAADEASISRLYGGIHFMDAIQVGQRQGREVGKWVIAKFSEGNLANPVAP